MTYGIRIRPALAALFSTELALVLTVLALTGGATMGGIA